MQTTSALYKKLAQDPACWKENRVTIAGEEYGEDRLIALRRYGGLFSGRTLSVGCACSRELDLIVRAPGKIPKAAKIIPSYRLVSGAEKSEWVQKGVYYIDTRETDKSTGALRIHAYDDMLRAEQTWEPDQALTFPMTFRAAAQEMARIMGVELDNAHEISDAYEIVDYPANDYTCRNILQFIAAAHGGNFIMTDLGKLRLVVLSQMQISYLADEFGNRITFGGDRIIV